MRMQGKNGKRGARLEGILYFVEKIATSTLDTIRIQTRGMLSKSTCSFWPN